MKKALIIFILLMLPLISSIGVDMKSEFDQGETLMAKVSGNFLGQLEKENIFFYREHVKIPLEYDMVKIDDEYYIYALLGDKATNNYSLSIEDVRYMQGTSISEEDIVKTFIITEEIADFSIDPGFIIADEPFTIKVQNLRDFKIEIKINENKTITGGLFDSLFKNLQGSEGDIELFSGEIKDLEFDLGNETSFRFVELSTENITYSIPVYVFVIKTTETQEENESSESSEEETTSEESEESETSEEEEEETKRVSTKTCSEENGTVCGTQEKCNGTIVQASDVACCLDTCEEIKEDNIKKIVGWSMIVIIALVVIWFFRTKYKKAKKEVNLLKIAKILK